MNKHFQLKLEQIKCLVEGCGACFTTDKITVEGNPIRFMYCEYPDNDVDRVNASQLSICNPRPYEAFSKEGVFRNSI